MFTSNTNKKSNLFLIAGIVILLVSVVGIIGAINQDAKTLNNSAFRYFLKASPTTPSVSVVTQATQISQGNDVPTTPVTIDYTVLNPGEDYIHSIARPELSEPNIPTRIEIPAIKLDAPVVIPDFNFTAVDGETFGQWQAPSEFAAGWHPDSALLGETGNTVINGHHNAFGMVFGGLVDLKVGDIVNVYAGEKKFSFVIANRMILPERYESAATRLENARWLAKSNDIRLTLVTCWPKETNTHRLILVARPLDN